MTLGVDAEFWADTEFQKIGEENWLKRKIKPRKFRGFWCSALASRLGFAVHELLGA